MHSRKMVLMKLFAEQQRKNRHKKQNYGHSRWEERVRCMQRVTRKFTLPYVK